jgi:uncharacterized membrane protein
MQRSPSSTGTNVGGAERIVSGLLGSAFLLSAMRRPSAFAGVRALIGGMLLHRGVTGHCYVYEAMGRKGLTPSDSKADHGARPQRSITIERPIEELYRMWRDPAHVSMLMSELAEVRSIDATRWHWRANLPAGRSIDWTTTIIEDRPNELLVWRTEPDAPFTHEVVVRFSRAPRDWGTQVTLGMRFGRPGGALSELANTLFSRIPKALEDEILRRCKSMSVAGEIPTLQNNPSARREHHAPLAHRALSHMGR